MRNMLKRFSWLFLFFAVLSLLTSPLPAKTSPSKLKFTLTSSSLVLVDAKKIQGELATVTGVIDGDTVILQSGKRVRLIGIDTPEKREPLCKEATEYLKTLVHKQQVLLEYDREKKDRYGRLLANIYVRHGSKGELTFVNGQMVAQGFARVYPYPPNLKYWKELTRMQKKARQDRLGLWALPRHSHESQYIGSKYRFHRGNCRNVRRIRRNRQIFSTMDEALDKGLSSARCCHPL